ncbi:hypothetical protein [Terrabacter sp. Soil810]|uniref:CIS tube protein n=1 Tax=Terrabacter sp. Soil810 TaxID=1736418 RepID=UPI00070890CD|nr:hypothetical protein [Terrabacter sp. Soil810]KRF46283.1 hypothetical protein ASG96_20550 [Terrabacter sp. Soil810]
MSDKKFEKAVLTEVEQKPSNPPRQFKRIEVQINPATLRLQTTASVDSGKDTGRQRTQYQGTTSTLSFDLIFDTSDEGTTDQPIDVRKRTAEIERFVWPVTKKAAPPRVQFTYGTLHVVGVMTSVNIDFDLFSFSGVPLRAKCAVQIKEQKAEFDLTQDGAGANTGAGASEVLRPGAAGGQPSGADRTPRRPTDRTGAAVAGESAPSFANRMGLDPKAWKGLQGIDDPMNLTAGQQIDYASDLSLDGGLGVQVGPGAVSSAPPGAGPTASDVPASPVPTFLPLSGPDLTSAGGLTNALGRLAASAAAGAAAAAVASFTGAAARSGSGTATTPDGPSTSGASAQPGTDRPDPRAVTYGYGAPLRPLRAVVGPAAVGLVHQRQRRLVAGGELPPESHDSTVPGWHALSARELALAPGPGGGCGSGGCGGCGGGCGSGGGGCLHGVTRVARGSCAGGCP